MAGGKADGDAIEEIRIAQFWRRALGEMEYVYHDADDLRRWYKALELRGPEEIREHLIAREGRQGMTHLHGLTPAPHPPIPIVELWLDSHESRIRLMPAWLGLGVFTVLTLLIGYNLNGCQTLKDPLVLNTIAQHTTAPLKAATQGDVPQPSSTLPNNPPPPAAQAVQSTRQGQQH